MNIVFVGDEPSNLNINKDIPFVGSKCLKRLIEWIQIINPDFYLVYNSNTDEQIEKISSLISNGFIAVSLGERASNRLKLKNIKHYKLPHPSGLNRKLNDSSYIDKQLNTLKNQLTSL